MKTTNNRKRKVTAINEGWPGMVYFVQGRKGSPIKVGYTNEGSSRSLNNRVLSLQTGNPEPLNVVSTLDPAYMSNEKAIHKFLEPWRIRPDGEWFEETAVMSFLEAVNYDFPELYKPVENKTLQDIKLIIEDESEEDGYKEFIDVVLGEKVKYIDWLLSAPKLPILGWLLLQEGRNDHVGDLAIDAKREPALLLEVSTLIDYSRKLPSYTWSALLSAYFECFSDAKSLSGTILPSEPLPWEKRQNAVSTL